MRLLFSNDDGFDAPGLQQLLRTVAEQIPEAEIWVVAPASEQSAKSHSLTLHKPLRFRARGDRAWAVSGTPADCVYLALHQLLPEPPDLVISGLNNGSNLGNDVHYSGTVAAAREACLHGFQAVAVSMHRHQGAPVAHFESGAQVAVRVIRHMVRHALPQGTLLNINVPDRPHTDLLGLRGCALGTRTYRNTVDLRHDPRGQPYAWIGGPHESFGPNAHTDGPLVEAGWATVTPLTAKITDTAHLERLRGWTDA